ncbi:DUF1415 domain-containing protein [Shewanella sp. C32]|uniref:DUF1415 domain-containing protein n=1 Tax=Shewanella electrica TaxID=515560 RepID=A0ABT2FGK4_9GAMM|nr:DUF1415 domain-containing protein [Shewanella electrica]MCH1923341.1 DUF1415 domain-containing protein [Shewanella electrica]MCS4555438.1 DUF1415 domain-containing protein [Shewanella electrica]
MSTTFDIDAIETEVNTWLEQVVIGLNLCPFAAKPQRNKQIQIHVSEATTEEELLSELFQCFTELDNNTAEELETTLVVVPGMLQDFFDYNQFIDWIEALLRQEQWDGTYQVATFHPDYCFANADADDPANLTNRAPYPIYHLIREASMSKVLEHYPNPEAIPDINIARVSALTATERQALFPHLFKSK